MSSRPEPTPQREFTVAEALRITDFWILLFAIALRVSITVALTIHFVPLFVWRGQTEAASAYLVSLFAMSTIPITLVCGWFGDRWDKTLICGLGVLPTMAGILLLMHGQSGISLYALPVGLGITMGTVPLNWALIGDFFGRRSYGTLRGIMEASRCQIFVLKSANGLNAGQRHLAFQYLDHFSSPHEPQIIAQSVL